MKIKILTPFVDIETHEDRLIGDEVEITEERFEQLKNNLPYDYFEVLEVLEVLEVEEVEEVEEKPTKKR